MGQGGRLHRCPAPAALALPVAPREGSGARREGIDVQLAVAEAILTDAADVAVLFTHDTDLLPAVEMVARLKGSRRIETASWSSGKFAQRLREIPGVHHHRISGKVFALVEEPVNYAHCSV